MRRSQIHRMWAPDGGAWTPWVKPVLFAAIDERHDAARSATEAPEIPPWLREDVLGVLDDDRSDPYRGRRALHDVAIVLDLPSVEGAELGVALTEVGFRPIPLYNAVPKRDAIVDLDPILRVIEENAALVARVTAAAPPAFLLDARRRGRGMTLAPGRFDNRSICRSSDFPSAKRLVRSGIRRVVLVTEALDDDLASVALEWQEGGLAIWSKDPSRREPVQPTTLRRPWLGRRLWNEIRRSALEPRADGTYGRMILEPSSS